MVLKYKHRLVLHFCKKQALLKPVFLLFGTVDNSLDIINKKSIVDSKEREKGINSLDKLNKESILIID